MEKFCRWMKSVGIDWDPRMIDIRGQVCGSGEAYGIVAVRDIDVGEIVGTIPKSAVLSVVNTGIGDLIENNRLGGGLGLSLAIIYERSLGKKSKWAGYLEWLPQREHLPLCWNEDEKALLQGTELESKVGSDMELLLEDFENEVVPIIKANPKRFPNKKAMSFENFVSAATLIASRAFGLDSEHGDSMTPFADIFNHRTAVVDVPKGFMLEGDDDDDDDDEDENDDDDDDEEEDDQTGMKRAKRIISRQAADLASNLPHDAPEVAALPRLEIAIMSAATNPDILHVICMTAVKAGNEIHNTYGELGNATLLNLYGFVPKTELANPFDFVSLSSEEFRNGCVTIVGNKKADARMKQLPSIFRTTGNTDNDNDGEEDDDEWMDQWGFHGTSRPSTVLAASACFLCATDQQAKKWASSAESMMVDLCGDVDGDIVAVAMKQEIPKRLFREWAAQRLHRYRDEDGSKKIDMNHPAMILRQSEQTILKKVIQNFDDNEDDNQPKKRSKGGAKATKEKRTRAK